MSVDYTPWLGKPCIVRARDASPHFGVVTGIEGRTVTMTQARRLWQWRVKDRKGISLSELALVGISDDWSRVSMPTEAVIQDACEVILCSEIAAETLRAIKSYLP